MNIYRADETNVGDWWSPPGRYFPFKPAPIFDILNSEVIPNDNSLYIVGGGGLGREFFRQHLLNLTKRRDKKYKLIAWGVGSDLYENREGIVNADEDQNLLGDFFEGFEEIGTRIWYSQEQLNCKWVPCASCLYPGFYSYRDKKPKNRIGFYFHKRVPMNFKTDSYLTMSNNGNNIDEKLNFISDHEYIVTNTYHGVYWATLLNRKVLCLPFKSGLYTFKHRPHYLESFPTDSDLELAKNYPDALDDCRNANIEYYLYLVNKYGAF